MFENLEPITEPPSDYFWSYRTLRSNMFTNATNVAVRKTGLIDRVQTLVERKQFRSAMEELFVFFERFPSNADALFLVLVSFFNDRSIQLESSDVKPLTPAQLSNRHLDSLFSTCVICEKTFIQQDELAFHFMNTVSSSSPNNHFDLFSMRSGRTMPDGAQCKTCGIAFCKNCIPLNVDGPDWVSIDRTCPVCGTTGISKRVLPNGRLPQSVRKTSNQIGIVLMFREGPLPPDQAYMEQVLKTASPQALAQNAVLVGVATRPERLTHPIYNQRIFQAMVTDLLITKELAYSNIQSIFLHGPGGLDCVILQVEASNSEEEAQLRQYAEKLFPLSEQVSEYFSHNELGQHTSDLYLEILNNQDSYNEKELQQILTSLSRLILFAKPTTDTTDVATLDTITLINAWLKKLAGKLTNILHALQMESDDEGNPYSWNNAALELRQLCTEYYNTKYLAALQALYGLPTRLKFEILLDGLWLIALSFSYPGKIKA